jgi:hypothetical protein
VRSWARSPCKFTINRQPTGIEIVCSFHGPNGAGERLEKRFLFSPDGSLSIRYHWDQDLGHPDDLFSPEISLFAPLELRTEPAAEVWTFPVETVAKSERGFDRTKQGESVTLRWPVRIGSAAVELLVPGRESSVRSAEGVTTGAA